MGDVAVWGGNQTLGRSGARASGGGPDHVSTDQEVLGVCGEDRAAIGGSTVAGGGGADIQGVERIDTAIFQDPKVDEGGGGVKLGGHEIGAGRSCGNVLGVIDSLGYGDRTGEDGGADGQLIKIALGIGDRSKLGGGIIPTDNDHIEIGRFLSRAKGSGDGDQGDWGVAELAWT